MKQLCLFKLPKKYKREKHTWDLVGIEDLEVGDEIFLEESANHNFEFWTAVRRNNHVVTLLNLVTGYYCFYMKSSTDRWIWRTKSFEKMEYRYA